VLLFGCGFAWIFRQMAKTDFGYQISSNTKACLRESVGYAAASWVLAMAPIGLVRKLGWENFSSFYYDVLWRNSYTTFLSFVAPVLLAAVTLFYPIKQDRLVKHELWAASCITAGIAVAPIFFKPRNLVTIAGGYTVGLVAPIAVALTMSSDFLKLNIFSFLGMGVGTLFMHNTGIPFVLSRRQQTGAVSSTVTSLMATAVVANAFFLLTTVNAHVLFIEKCHRESSQKTVEKPKWSLSRFFDGTDPVSNGLLMASYTGFTFYRLLSASVRLARKLRKGGEKSSSTLEDLIQKI